MQSLWCHLICWFFTFMRNCWRSENLSPRLMIVYLKQHMAVVTAKPIVNRNPTFFLSKWRDKCIIQDDIKRSILHHHVNGDWNLLRKSRWHNSSAVEEDRLKVMHYNILVCDVLTHMASTIDSIHSFIHSFYFVHLIHTAWGLHPSGYRTRQNCRV